MQTFVVSLGQQMPAAGAPPPPPAPGPAAAPSPTRPAPPQPRWGRSCSGPCSPQAEAFWSTSAQSGVTSATAIRIRSPARPPLPRRGPSGDGTASPPGAARAAARARNSGESHERIHEGDPCVFR